MMEQILIVEDDQVTSESIRLALEQNGYKVQASCASGEEALNQMGHAIPDVVLMDIRLKGELNGIQVAEKLLKKYQVPIIYLTDVIDPLTLKWAKKTRPSNYLTKPFQTHQLLVAIEFAVHNTSNPDIKSTYCYFKENGQAIKVNYDEILFLKSARAYCEVHTTKRKITLSQSMKDIYKQIPCADLIRVSRSFVINKNHVEKIMGKMVIIGNERVKVTNQQLLQEHFHVI